MTSRKRDLRYLLTTLFFSSLFLPNLTQAHQAECTDANLRGTYGFNASGVTLAGVEGLPEALLGPFASAGTATYDGKGQVRLAAAASFNGVILPAEAMGTYRVEPDCSFTSSVDNGSTFRAVIVGGGQTLLVLQTNPGTVISGTADKQNGARPSTAPGRLPICSRRTVVGDYGFLATRQAGPPTLPPEAAGPLVGVGMVSYADDGSFKMSAQRSVNGVLDPEVLPLSGRYAITPGCGIEMVFDVGFHFTGQIADSGRTLRFVETDPGTALIVTAQRR